MDTINDVSIALYRPTEETKPTSVRRAMLQIPGVMETLGNIERAVFAATTDVAFSEYDDARLVTLLGDSLKWIAKDVGIRDTESNDWKVAVTRIAQVVKRYYPAYTIKDMKMAFEMTATGELNDFFPKDRNGNPDKEHYQMFNVDYFCKVMNAYKTYRTGVIVKANNAVPKPEQQRNPENERFYRNASRRDAIVAYAEYKHRGRLPKLSPIGEMLLYENLAKVGLAEPVVVTENEQKIILRATLYDLVNAERMADKRKLESEGVQAESIQFDAYRLARRKAIKATFDWMIDNDVMITDYMRYERG